MQDKIQINVRLPVYVLEEIDKSAALNCRTRSGEIEKAMREYLDLNDDTLKLSVKLAGEVH